MYTREEWQIIIETIISFKECGISKEDDALWEDDNREAHEHEVTDSDEMVKNGEASASDSDPLNMNKYLLT